MPKAEKKKPKVERDSVKRAVQKKRNYLEGKEKKIKREGERIPRRLEHKGKINKYEAVDRIAKARRGRVHDASGIYKEGKSVKGQYFRTGLARDEILRQKETANSPKSKGYHPGQKRDQMQKLPKKTTVNNSVDRSSTKVNKIGNKRLISAAQGLPLPPAKKQRKLGKLPNKRKTQPNQSYREIRNRFELASGGRNVLENKVPLITAQSEASQVQNNEKRQRQIRTKSASKISKVLAEQEIVEGSQEGEEENIYEGEKFKKLQGVKLIGLGSKIEKTSKKPTVISQQPNTTALAQTIRMNTLTRNKIKIPTKIRENVDQQNRIEEIATKVRADVPFSKEYGTLVARRIRKIPGKKLKKHQLVLEEIHELPPITLKKKELKTRFPEKNLEKFDELRKKYRFLNSIITTRNILAKCTKCTIKGCRKIVVNITNFFKNGENSEWSKGRITEPPHT